MQATFYSRTAQAYFSSDTGEVEPAGLDPTQVPTLETNDLSFGLVHRALVKSGYDDAALISATNGVDVRVNAATLPFGPPDAPKDTILYHVSLERLGEIRDLFVSGADGTVFQYT